MNTKDLCNLSVYIIKTAKTNETYYNSENSTIIPNCNSLFLYYNTGWVSAFIQQPQSQTIGYSQDLMTENISAEWLLYIAKLQLVCQCFQVVWKQHLR